MRASRLITSVGLLLVGLGLWIGFVGESHEKQALATRAPEAASTTATGAVDVARPASPAHLPGLTLIETAPASDARSEVEAARSDTNALPAGQVANTAPASASEILGQAATVAGSAAIARQSAATTGLAKSSTAGDQNVSVMRPVTVRPPQSVIDEAAASDAEDRGDVRKSSPAQRRIRSTAARTTKPQVRESSNLLTNPLGVR